MSLSPQESTDANPGRDHPVIQEMAEQQALVAHKAIEWLEHCIAITDPAILILPKEDTALNIRRRKAIKACLNWNGERYGDLFNLINKDAFQMKKEILSEEQKIVAEAKAREQQRLAKDETTERVSERTTQSRFDLLHDSQTKVVAEAGRRWTREQRRLKKEELLIKERKRRLAEEQTTGEQWEQQKLAEEQSEIVRKNSLKINQPTEVVEYNQATREDDPFPEDALQQLENPTPIQTGRYLVPNPPTSELTEVEAEFTVGSPIDHVERPPAPLQIDWDDLAKAYSHCATLAEINELSEQANPACESGWETNYLSFLESAAIRRLKVYAEVEQARGTTVGGTVPQPPKVKRRSTAQINWDELAKRLASAKSVREVEIIEKAISDLAADAADREAITDLVESTIDRLSPLDDHPPQGECCHATVKLLPAGWLCVNCGSPWVPTERVKRMNFSLGDIITNPEAEE